MAGYDNLQFVNPQMAWQGAFYNAQQQQPVYSYEELQLLQQSLLSAKQQDQNLAATSREGVVSPAALGLYSVPEAVKCKTDPAYSSMPLAQQQQIAASNAAAVTAVPSGTFMTMVCNGGMPPYVPYSLNVAIPGAYSQYATPTHPQMSSNSYNAAAYSQFPVQPKFVYGGPSVYNKPMSPQEYENFYNDSQKNKKPRFHSGTPPPALSPELGMPGTSFNLPNAYAPMLVSPMSLASQYPSPLVHHQLNQDAESVGGRRTMGGIPNNGVKKGGPSRSNWGPN